ncbi:hypothetical protein [Methanoregula sp. UBA64]|uniref:hypothetical protein n=1 Tax=Methanoregula sp. UBA64 TaxID=1915554 RepID=UPI0025CFE0EA|nr:hypothetical protein [Methanoregula sp. UBA64]
MNVVEENRKEDNRQFYMGWGLAITAFALLLIAQSIFKDVWISSVVFLIILGCGLIALGSVSVKMPIVSFFGVLCLLIGLGIIGIFFVHIDILLIIGLIIIIFVLYFVVTGRNKING